MPAEVVIGVGASHSTLMNTHWEQTADRAGAQRYADALADARDRIAAAGADVAVIIGSNHFRGFWLDLIPAFTVGVGECVASGESGTPAGPQPVDQPLARHLVDTLVGGGRFDPAYSARLQIDHGQSHAIQYLLAGLELPIVPIVINVFAHPLPTVRRCLDFGAAVRTALHGFAADRRVAVIGSGGLSHRLPWPDWRDPSGDDEEFMVRAWLDGRDNWRDYDGRRREIIQAAQPVINPEFDEQLLALLEAGKGAQLAEHTTEQLEREAGNGGQEIRTWLTMAAALSHAPATRLAYEPMPEWLTGMAVAVLEPAGHNP
jgi:2,3-dihydroxyphenylpropionate 1,2-dioxygenase